MRGAWRRMTCGIGRTSKPPRSQGSHLAYRFTNCSYRGSPRIESRAWSLAMWSKLLILTDACPTAELLASKDGEDVYVVNGCRVTCRFRIEPGDFVSRQMLA